MFSDWVQKHLKQAAARPGQQMSLIRQQKAKLVWRIFNAVFQKASMYLAGLLSLEAHEYFHMHIQTANSTIQRRYLISGLYRVAHTRKHDIGIRSTHRIEGIIVPR